ncbi:sensor histidine kinase [Ulvibacter litoralis]|uniref:histidine kinase n=1 Tax=Ulvibacter litoralis TaxID=227084 RepID=A0A1G7CUL4_9FLAO|nr:HAMP domain-containing sensor histidine kinase [Ulvibacter litoralis]GHC46173.1 two-component sensor histidine kinase [Ulvibacter litoralis]SDE42450.1 Histidine kinase-, DNA gyrase B-, and HSP90-like ATPase [Ulvibacter litoralis]
MQNNTTLTRWVFIFSSLCIIGLILWNTYSFFNQLKENERTKMQIWATAQTELQNDDKDAVISDTSLEVIKANTTTPMLVYSHREQIYTERNLDKRDVNTPEKIENLVVQFKSEYKPIEIKYNDELLATIYYGNSPIIKKLKYYPAVLILIIFLFIAAIYLFYKTSKSAEQNKLWAGMAKETAHQIGTPLSSLVGWTEIFKTENINQEYIVEMEKDIHRLETITERFSKIGSIPKLEKTDLIAETKATFDYLKRRSSKLIKFELDVPDDEIYVKLNSQLYSWTIENMVKNGIDAMRGKGTITVSIETNAKYAMVRISDTGKGIAKRDFKKIFRPGYTSKKRGWGLGLSLSKRIISEYHNGKIRVLKSSPETGTTMEIALQFNKLT